MDLYYVLYDIPNESITFCDKSTIPTETQSKANVIKMTYAQAEMIRRAKKLDMPIPPIKKEDRF